MSGMANESRELRAFAPALVLLAICALINYVDRGNLSIAAPLLKDELGISVTQRCERAGHLQSTMASYSHPVSFIHQQKDGSHQPARNTPWSTGWCTPRSLRLT